MKRSILTIVLLIALVLLLVLATVWYRELSAGYDADDIAVAGESSEQSVAQAEQAADFTVLDYDGNEVSLSQLTGRPIIINFWATWCGPCSAELPYFDRLCGEYGEDIQFMMVNMTDGSRDTIESVKAFIDDAGYSFPVYFDTELEAAYAYGVYSIPRTVIISSDGTISAVHSGLMSEDQLKTYLEHLITTEKEN